MPYSVLLKPRHEVLSGEGVDGIIDLANLAVGKKRALENDPARFFSLTYPTADIRQVVDELDRRFNSEQQTAGLYLFEGLNGTGKSHLLLFVYHLFHSRREAAAWLSRHGLQCRLPDDAVVVANKFTDLPPASIWAFICERLRLPHTDGTLAHPDQAEAEQALAGRRLVFIFDELERAISVIADPAIRAQNIAFLQMLSEWASRSSQVTLLASSYGPAQGPGQTLNRAPNCWLQFSNFEDRERVVLHRIFENADAVNRQEVPPILERYINIWQRYSPVPEEYIARFRNSFPFSPDLTDVLLNRVFTRDGFHGIRGALGFMAALVRLTIQKTDLITPAHASLNYEDIRSRLAVLTPHSDLMEQARNDANILSGKYPLAPGIAAATLLYTVSGAVESEQMGCTIEELQRAVLTLDTDSDDFTQALGALEKFGAHFHCREARYYFDPRDKSDAEVEFQSPSVDTDRAQELLRKLWLQDVFHDDGSGVIFSDVQRTREALNILPEDRLRFVLAPRRLSATERHDLFYDLELRNQVVLLEVKEPNFDLHQDPDLLTWAQRLIAAHELANSAEDAERGEAYERIEHQYKTACVNAITSAGLVFVHWQVFAAIAAEDEVELQVVPGSGSREEALDLLQTQLYPEQAFIDHLLGRGEEIFDMPVGMIERDYQQVLGYPIAVNNNEAVIGALKHLCSESRIGIQHSRENVCGSSPTLSSSEMREAIVVPPFSIAVEEPEPIPPVYQPEPDSADSLPSAGPSFVFPFSALVEEPQPIPPVSQPEPDPADSWPSAGLSFVPPFSVPVEDPEPVPPVYQPEPDSADSLPPAGPSFVPPFPVFAEEPQPIPPVYQPEPYSADPLPPAGPSFVLPFPVFAEEPQLIPPASQPEPAFADPLPQAGPSYDRSSPSPPVLAAQTQELKTIPCLPKDSPGELRFELASKLAGLNEPSVRQVTFKVFLRCAIDDLNGLSPSIRGGLKGPGEVTAEWQIVKDGDFSEAEIETFAELLPAIRGAKYDATMKVATTEEQRINLECGV